jgi:enoyl-CoA hydratase/carnithine racemase
MASLFQYNTICTQLARDTRTLTITLNRADKANAINLEVLFELDSILNWASSKIEISSIFINSSTHRFSIGLGGLENTSSENLEQIQKKLTDIQKTMLELPQTIIIDYGLGASNLGIEIGMAADMRLCDNHAKFHWDYFKKGLPAFGSHFLTKELVGLANLKKWLSASTPQAPVDLKACGFITESYDFNTHKAFTKSYLQSITEQSPIARIQTKLNLNQHLISILDQTHYVEFNVFKASLTGQDWTKASREFKTAVDIKKSVRMTLIKTEETL